MSTRNQVPNAAKTVQPTQSSEELIKKLEPVAARIVEQLKRSDEALYKQYNKPLGGRYLDNKALISQTELYKLAYKAPKGAHLHIHFNSCLGPNVLLDIAAEDAVKHNMFISTNVQGALTKDNLEAATIQFHFLPAKQDKVKSVFDTRYKGRKTPTDKESDKMLFQDFLASFQSKIGMGAFPKSMQSAVGNSGSKALAMMWLRKKLVFSSDEVTYSQGSPATVAKQWNIFNTRTQMMKGLFNYEHAYRRYTQKLLAEFVKENIQYAEIRPNFMMTNQIYKTSNPDLQMNNFEIMLLIIEEVKKFKANETNKGFGGLKVIYCTPRSFSAALVKESLKECLEMKKDRTIGPYIAGFDVIGPENAPNPLKYFKKEFKEFQVNCSRANVECPFLFHAGESHVDNDPEGNLNVAMELKSKRIAHGFAIPKNAKVKAWAKEKRVCIECCPISNEILGLDPFIKNAAVYDLMAAQIPCALASDNPTLFSSNLSYDFYQFMIGDSHFALSRWRKLMEDSLTHAIWNSDSERNAVVQKWRSRYVKFLQDILSNDKSPSSADADKKQRQTNGDATRTTNLPVRPAAVSGPSNGSGMTSSGAKPVSQQVTKSSKQQAPRSAGTALGQTNKPVNKAQPTKQVAKTLH